MGLPAATWARADGARGARNWGTAAGRRCHFVCDGHRMGTAAAMDRMLKRAKNMEMFEDEMEAEFRKDVMKFFKDYIMPLLPKEAKVEVAHDGIVMWRNLLGKDVRAEDVGRKREAGGGDGER